MSGHTILDVLLWYIFNSHPADTEYGGRLAEQVIGKDKTERLKVGAAL